MASTNDATVNAFYLAYYGRPADPAGLAYWSQALTASNGDFGSIISAFSTSSEATAHIGTGSATDQISNVYQQLFGHAPDAAGLAYWTAAISSGNMSLADAAFQITEGAQTSDLTVSTLRQEAAAQFTATIAASGADYDGDAGIAAARVMIAAVNATSSTADIQSLVTAGASLAQTAHDNPAIITALANGGDLNTLLSTASGQSDPVALVQALASLGKAAVADPAGLTTLLHGGGVAGLLASLPAGTTLKDVAAAVDAGGLAAGTTVATAPVDTTPVDTSVTITPVLAFNGIDGKPLPAGTTIVTNSTYYSLHLAGVPDDSTYTFQVSTTGTGGWVATPRNQLLDDGTYYIRYSVTDKAGDTGVSNAVKLVMDHTVASPTLQLAHDTGTSATDHITSDGTINVTGLDANESWTYSFDGINWAKGTTVDGVGTVLTTGEGTESLTVRTVETVNGQSHFTSTIIGYNVDTTAPAAPASIHLVNDTGSSDTDGVTSSSEFMVTGLQPGATWKYTSDGMHWFAGGTVASDGTAVGYAALPGTQTVQAVTYDVAGNTSAPVSTTFTVDNSTPADGLKFDHIEGGTAGDGVASTTLSHADLVFSYTGTVTDTDVVTYSINGVQTTLDPSMVDSVNKTITVPDVDLSTSDAQIVVHVTSLSGMLDSAGQYISGPYNQSTAFVNSGDLYISLGATKNGHIYLTDGDNASIQVHSNDVSGDAVSGGWVTLGVQTTAAQGFLSVGPSATVHTDSSNSNSASDVIYALGTDGADTLSGNYVFAYGGDDVITAVGDPYNYGNSTIYAGMGSDTIHLEASRATLLYTSASESTIVADDTAAHGFDTLDLATGASVFNEQLSFADVSLDAASFTGTGTGYTGNETGNALLGLLNGVVTGTLPTDGVTHAELIDFGMVDGKDVHFLVIDTGGDGTIGAGDYVVKLVGDMSHAGFGGHFFSFQSGTGTF